MSFLDSIFGGLGLPGFSDITDAYSGRSGAEASIEGARQQAMLGRAGIAQNEEALRRLEATLAPFVGAGGNLIEAGQALFGPNAAQNLQNDPRYAAAQDRMANQILARQAVRGGRGDTANMLQSGLGTLGSDYLSRLRGDYLSGIGLGQASAAQQASGGLQTGQRASDLLSQIGNSLAAGQIGAANSLSQGTQNQTAMAAAIASFFSDRRLKRNISKIGTYKDYDTYKYQYIWSDDWYIGVMSDDVKRINPSAVSQFMGYDMVNYGAL